MPPTIFKYTSWLPSGRPTTFSSTAISNVNLLKSIPFAVLLGKPNIVP